MEINSKTLEQQRIADRRTMKYSLWGVGIGVFIGVICAVFMPLLVTQKSLGNLGVTKPNEIGDTIGGIMGPSVGIIGALLTFLAFYAQIRANNDQRHQFRQSLVQQQEALEKQTQQFTKTLEQQESSSTTQKQQAEAQIKLANQQVENSRNDARRERFANRYYMMMEVHRDNVAAFDVGHDSNKRYSGRRALLPLFNELKFLYWSTVYFHNNRYTDKQDTNLSPEDIFQISYLTFFFGFGQVSTPLVLDLLKEEHIKFASQLHRYLGHMKSRKIFAVSSPNGTVEYESEYALGTGHLRRLSHYFRHLYQTVKYVDNQDYNLLNYAQKYNYVSNLRAQLSVHEQLLLYYNSLSVLGSPWMDVKNTEEMKEGLLARYCMVKSIPLNAADFYKAPVQVLGQFNTQGKAMFEWTEIRRRMNDLSV